MKKLQLLQTFRGLAALLVVFYHITANSSSGNTHLSFLGGYFVFGGAGVDFFFVLSGFIIYYSSDKLLKQNKQLQYLKNRLTRIYPVYIIVACTLLVAQLFLPAFFKQHFDFYNIIGTLLLLPNHVMVNGVSWSLSYELYFYLFFLIVFSIKRSYLPLLITLGYGLLISVLAIGFKHLPFYLNPLILSFILGLIAVPISSLNITKRYSAILLILGIILFFLSGTLVYLKMPYLDEIKRVIYYGLPSFLIVTGAVSYEYEKHVSSPKALLLLGDISYSLYLIHLPLVVVYLKIINILSISNALIGNFVLLLGVTFIVLITYIFHLVIELPLMRFFHNRNKAVKSID